MRYRTRVASTLFLLIAVVGSASAQSPTPPVAPTLENRIRALEKQNHELQRKLDLVQREMAAAAPKAPELAVAPPAAVDRPISVSGPESTPPTRPEKAGEGTRVDLEQGVQIISKDDRFRVEFHNLSQFDGRFFSATGSGPDALHNNFDIPRQRLYFNGQVDDAFDFYTVLNRGYGSFDVLDAYVNFKFDKRFNVRVGRTKTPYSYEYYKVAEGDLVAPERSVFVGNLSPNRQIGAMAYGRLLDERVEYAAGLFNGPHRSFQDFNNYKNPFFFVNTKPFLNSDTDLFRHLNVGGSVNFGREDDPLEPTALRTANDETTTGAINNVSPAFLRFTPDAREFGRTAFWSGDVTWFYRSATMLSNYTGGFITYAQPNRPTTEVPYQGYSVAFTYFLTGEEITARKEVKPLRPFRLHDPRHNPGAIEPYVRFSYLRAGANVFSSGLADPRTNSRDAAVLDLGANWYLNQYLRIFLDWQHAEFGSPVQIGSDKLVRSSNLFWFRTQLYY